MKCKYLILSILALASCTKEVSVIKEELPELPSEAVEKATVNVSICAGRQTKATGFSDSFDYESKINDIQLLIFDTSTGMINYYKDLGKNMSGTPALYIGPKTVYALANGPSLATVSTLTELQARTYTLKEYNSTSGMIMMATDEFELDEDQDITLYLDRLVARIYVNTVNNKLPAAYSTIKILSAFMGNVPSEIGSFGAYVSSASLVNKDGVLDDPVYDMTYKEVNKDVVSGTPCSVATPLYCYKNEVIADNKGAFVSLKVEVGGEQFYYTVFLDPADLVMNATSDLNLNIVGLGSTDPSKPVEKLAIDYDIEVREWQFASAYTETI